MEQRGTGGRAVVEAAHWTDWYARPPQLPPDSDWARDEARIRGWDEAMTNHHARMAGGVPDGRVWHLRELWTNKLGGGDSVLEGLRLAYFLAVERQPETLPNPEAVADAVATGRPSLVDALHTNLDRAARIHLWRPDAVQEAYDLLSARHPYEWENVPHARHVLNDIRRSREPNVFSAYRDPRGFSAVPARQVLDWMLCSAEKSTLLPGTEVTILRDGERIRGRVRGYEWGPSGPATAYMVRVPDRGYVPEEWTVPASQVEIATDQS